MNKVFGIGLSRTGTTSLSLTLKEAGLNVIHYPNYNTLFSINNDGASDLPVAAHFKELDVKFPHAKFVYTTRDRENWLDSMEAYLKNKVDRFNVTAWQQQNRIAVYGQIELDRKHFNREHFAKKFDEHDKKVREYFKDRPNDLLIINLVGGDDASMLWHFLDLDFSLQFPHANKRI